MNAQHLVAFLIMVSCTDPKTTDTSTPTDSGATVPSEDVGDGTSGSATSSCGGFSIGTIPEEYADFESFFSGYVSVCGVNIFATANTDGDSVLHTARVLAQYLDNDEDGEPDDPAVHQAMVDREGGTSMILFDTEREIETSGIFETTLPDRYALQDLYGEEIHPGGSSSAQGFDATLEEVLHLITVYGYADAYPDTLGIDTTSELAAAMDLARGGHYTSVPDSYPEEAWYHYRDRTCDYRCMMVEYLYWALTSHLGAQDYTGRCAEIANEWEPCTSDLFEETDLLAYGLITDPNHHLPTTLPDATYAAE